MLKSMPDQFVKIILLILTILVLGSNPNVVYGKIHVKITNNLEHNLDLTLHCKSGDDDLGQQLVHQNEFFEFKFNRNFFGNTLFYCSFEWKGGFHRFDIVKENRDTCVECNWSIVQKHPCLVLDITTPFSNCFHWDS